MIAICIAIQNFITEVLLQFYIALYPTKHFCIYYHLPLACFWTIPFGTLTSLCIILYLLVICTFVFAS